MAQIIRLPVWPSEYPATVDGLDHAEQLLVLAIRSWVADRKSGNNPTSRLCDTMSAAGAPDAAFSLDQFMTVAGRTAKRAVAIRCPRCPRVSEDEAQLLHAACLAQHGDRHLAAVALRHVLLSAFGADCTFDLLESLGEMFKAAGLRFRRRRPPHHAIESLDSVERWEPLPEDRMVH
jgi:hypothetical protein